MDNIYQFDREYMIKAIWYIQSLLNKPNISNKVKRELRSNLNTLKNLYERNYEFYNDIHFKVPSDLEKLKRISLNKMRLVYKTLGIDLINWLLDLEEREIFNIDEKSIEIKTNLDLSNQAELTLENYSIHSKKYLSVAEPIILGEDIQVIEEVNNKEKSSEVFYIDFLQKSFIVIDSNQAPSILNHEIQHCVEDDLKYITHNMYEELGPHYIEMLFLDILYNRQGYLLSGDYGFRIYDAKELLDVLYGYLSCVIVFARNNFNVSLDTFLDTIMNIYGVNLEDAIKIIKTELITTEYLEDMNYLFSYLKAIELRERTFITKRTGDSILEPYINSNRFKFYPSNDFSIYERYIEEMKQKTKILKK